METRFRSVAFTVTGALLIWVAVFLVSYLANAVACARGFADATAFGLGVVPATVAVATLAGLAGIAALAARALRTPSSGPLGDRELRYVTLVVCGLGAIGVVLNALPALLIAARC